VDSGEFWRSECEKLHQSNRDLKEEIRIASERRRLSEEQLRLANERIRSLERDHNRDMSQLGKRRISLRDIVPAEDDLWAEDILHTSNDHVLITSYCEFWGNPCLETHTSGFSYSY
jgi:chromosome segregation ATPase